MVNLHNTLYQRMSEEREAIGLIFTDFVHFLKIYKTYLTNFEIARTRRGFLLTNNRKFADFLDKAKNHERCNGIGIEAFLIEPVQRIPRYRLLLEQLLKYTREEHPEYLIIKKALNDVSEVAYSNNEAMRLQENREKVMEVMMTFETRTRVNLLDDPVRTFIKEGNLKKQCRLAVLSTIS